MTTKRVTAALPEEPTEVLVHRDRIDRLGELSDWLQQEYGSVTDEELAEARRVREAALSRAALRMPERAQDEQGRTTVSGYARWQDIRAEHVDRAGGEELVQAGKKELLAEVTGQRLAELRQARELTQQEVADRMGVTKRQISQIERGHVSGQDVLARYAEALGGRLRQAIYFEDGDIAAIS